MVLVTPLTLALMRVFWEKGVGYEVDETVLPHLLTTAGQEACALIPILLSQDPLWELMGG